MLILTRYIGEKIIIGDDLTMEVVDAYFDRGTIQVKLRMSSPKSVLSTYSQIVVPVYPGDSITMGEDTYIEVVDAYPFKGRIQVRLGIQAPRSVPVHRFEIYERIKNGEKRELPKSGSDKQLAQ